ncbi:hypothetical protein BB560_000709 [Smittium megazygosporum]|uniref:Ankyrin repeat protein n=1 Tax=Smittium megazygosporum TaxID=133381 RepID=A0A2T9ZJP1_9FUNG|nr:hypothetical protein BB560_000709 [Smittium megazygosporum]
MLIEGGIDIHTEDDWALRCASFNGRFELVNFLVENCADTHAENECAIRWESTEGCLDIVKFSVENGANVQADDNRAFRNALRHGKIETMGYLHDSETYDQIKQAIKDENYNSLDESSFTQSTIFGLHVSCKKDRLEIVKYLLNLVVYIHRDDEIALIYAAKGGSTHMIRFLVENGANLDDHGEKAFICALGHDKVDAAEFFVDKGVKLEANKESLLVKASASARGNVDFVKFLAENGPNGAVSIDLKNNTLLYIATFFLNKDIVEYLLDKRFDIHSNNDSALMWEKFKNNKYIFDCVLRNRANASANAGIFIDFKYKAGSEIIHIT